MLAVRFVLVDAAGPWPGSYRISGRYRVEGSTLAVTAYVLRGDEEVASFDAGVPDENLDALTAQIVERAKQHFQITH